MKLLLGLLFVALLVTGCRCDRGPRWDNPHDDHRDRDHDDHR